MKAALSFLINPLPILYLLLGLSGLAIYFKRKTSAKILFISSLGLLLLVSTGFFPALIVSSLEKQHAPLSTVNQIDTTRPIHILVLGGGHTEDQRLPSNDQLSKRALSRITESIRLHFLLPHSTIITSGGSGKTGISQAEVLKNTAMALGIEENEIMCSVSPRNTREEAQAYAKLYNSPLVQTILVTDAIHMPRALYFFQEEGINPIPAPTNHYIKEDDKRNWHYFLPSSRNIYRTELAIHEYTGHLIARMSK